MERGPRKTAARAGMLSSSWGRGASRRGAGRAGPGGGARGRGAGALGRRGGDGGGGVSAVDGEDDAADLDLVAVGELDLLVAVEASPLA